MYRVEYTVKGSFIWTVISTDNEPHAVAEFKRLKALDDVTSVCLIRWGRETLWG